jgi:hypothetical protein
MTVFGRFPIERTALIPSTPEDESRLETLGGKKIIFPLDEALGLDRLPFRLSVAAMLEISHWVQEIPSYQAATRAIRRNTLIDVKEDTVRAVANHIGSMVFEADKANAENTWNALQAGKLKFPNKKLPHDFYIEVDGAMIHTRRIIDDSKSVAEGEGDESPKSPWMENKLGMVFNSKDFIWWRDTRGEMQHSIGLREYIAYIGEVNKFKKFLFDMAIRNNYGHYQNTILISDGATWIRNMKDELYPDAHQILDLFHLCENVHKFAKEVFNQDEEISKPWAKNICDLFKESKYNEAIKNILSLGKRRLSKAKFNLINYINNNIDNIDYVEYRNRGWYVGSGAIESGNKTVLQFRLKQPGMRWRQDCGQGIVSLMAKAKSGLWERDVMGLVRSRYDPKGAGREFARLVVPVSRHGRKT